MPAYPCFLAVAAATGFLRQRRRERCRRKGGPEIAFPVDGSTIALVRQGQALKSLPLDADGGALPLLWLVNGKRIDSTPFRREAEWQPDGPGEVRITVIDGAGRVASSEVWVQ